MIGPIHINVDRGLELPLPAMAPVKQRFDESRLEQVREAAAAQMGRPEIAGRIRPGDRIAVGVGSRGVANIGEVTGAVLEGIKARGGEPFIFPAMGSHGGASAEGQAGVLASYGISREALGVEVLAGMETVVLGRLPEGLPIHVDRHAAGADGIILINRVKPHTLFRGPVGSGIQKMMAVGMGKIAGAATLHSQGAELFGELIPRIAAFVAEKLPVLFGVALVENGYDQTAIVEAIEVERLREREAELLAEARRMMPGLYFDELELLIIEEMGKDISGAGLDPNVTGRQRRGLPWGERPRIRKIAVLDLSRKSHGNATGVGAADVITRELFEKIDFSATYTNVITSTFLDSAAIPIVMNSEEEAIRVAVKTLTGVDSRQARIVRIGNTAELENIWVSEPLLEEVGRHLRMEAAGEPRPFLFDNDGRFVKDG